MFKFLHSFFTKKPVEPHDPQMMLSFHAHGGYFANLDVISKIYYFQKQPKGI